MKKGLLSIAFAFMLSLTANAQQELVLYSFESTETAAYLDGDDIGNYSQYWGNYSSANDDDVNSGDVIITSEWSSDGAQSLVLNGTNTQNDDLNYVYNGALDYGSYFGDADFELTTDVYTNQLDNNSSDFWLQIYSYDSAAQSSDPIAMLVFDYSGYIYVYDPATDEYTNSYVSFEANTAYTVKVLFSTNGTLSYYLDDELLGEITPDASLLTGYYYHTFAIDDYASNWYVDKIAVNVPTAATQSVAETTFSVYPNPSNNIVNIANAKAQINGVKIVDINGRTVKIDDFSGVATAQVNIADLANGVYMMTINSDKGTVTKKIVKN
nr:T9SS type A sorting domain-containing protein [uncultured Flavobacterium sp.]